MDLSTQLLQMIHNVSHAEDMRTASVSLLHPILRHLQMEQAVFCECNQNEALPIFAMDHTRQILKKEDLWLSRTLILGALDTMEPVVHITEEDTNELPGSIHRNGLAFIVVLPISQESRQVIYLASRQPPSQRPGEYELEQLRTATKAAVLALQQQKHFVQLREQNKDLLAKLKGQDRKFLHGSPLMAELVEEIKRVAPFNISILLQGESGSGKEEIAQFIHQSSGRKGRFIAVNCANLTESLLESELFGHVKGAFTGAVQPRMGLLAEAADGTFFLDEIGELPLGLQAKFLRVLQERSVRPLGGNKDIPINIRFLAASHQDLWRLVQEKKFREDLYYRIQELVVRVPPLRERTEDITLLAGYFVHQFSEEFRMFGRRLAEGAIEKLKAYSWPGNVRELKNACRMAVVLSRTDQLEAANFRFGAEPAATATPPQATRAESPGRAAAALDPSDKWKFVTHVPPQNDFCLRSLLDDLEKKIIHSMLEESGATQSSVAKRLGVSIRTLQRNLL